MKCQDVCCQEGSTKNPPPVPNLSAFGSFNSSQKDLKSLAHLSFWQNLQNQPSWMENVSAQQFLCLSRDAQIGSVTAMAWPLKDFHSFPESTAVFSRWWVSGLVEKKTRICNSLTKQFKTFHMHCIFCYQHNDHGWSPNSGVKLHTWRVRVKHEREVIKQNRYFLCRVTLI